MKLQTKNGKETTKATTKKYHFKNGGVKMEKTGLTMSEAARYVGVSRQYIYMLAQQCKLKFFWGLNKKLSKKIKLFEKENLESLKKEKGGGITLEDCLAVKDVAKQYPYITNLVFVKKIPTIKVGAKRYILKRDLDELLPTLQEMEKVGVKRKKT